MTGYFLLIADFKTQFTMLNPRGRNKRTFIFLSFGFSFPLGKGTDFDEL